MQIPGLDKRIRLSSSVTYWLQSAKTNEPIVPFHAVHLCPGCSLEYIPPYANPHWSDPVQWFLKSVGPDSEKFQERRWPIIRLLSLSIPLRSLIRPLYGRTPPGRVKTWRGRKKTIGWYFFLRRPAQPLVRNTIKLVDTSMPARINLF